MTGRKANPVDHLLDAIAEAITNRKHPDSLWQKAVRLCRRTLKVSNACYTAWLLVLLVGMTWAGERHWFTGFCLYLPHQAWLLPLLLLAPLTLFLCRKWLWLHLGCLLLVGFGFYSFHWSWPRAPQKPVISVMTNNFGQNYRQDITSFLTAENPDVVAFQEAPGRAGQFVRAYTNYQAATVHQFVLLSKYPIRNSGYVAVYDKNKLPVAAWFEVDLPGQTVVIYNVHLPTPRRDLARSYGLGILAALAGIGQENTRLGKFRLGLIAGWAQRVELARKLADHFRQEQRPFIVAGDFNTPERGYIYRLFAGELQDAFATSGRGYGFTFPGYSNNPLTLFGPWLRIDYLFAGKGFRPVACHTEAGRKSQHRAVAAKFERVGTE